MNRDMKEGLGIGLVFAALIGVMSTETQAEERCIPEASVDRIEVVDRRTLRFEMRNGDVYLNKLNGSLNGSFNFDPLVFDRTHRSAQYCRLDGVGVADRISRPGIPGRFGSLPLSASLGNFELVESDED